MKLPFWWYNLNNYNLSEQNKQNKEINPEFEEKPVVDSISKTSEDYHGGDEITFSMDTQSDNNMEYIDEHYSTENQESSENENSSDKCNEQDSLGDTRGTNYSEESEHITKESTDKVDTDDENTTEDSDDSNGNNNYNNDNNGNTDDTDDNNNDDTSTTDYSGERKLNVSVILREEPIYRKLRTEFQRFIEKIAELETKYEIPNGTQKLSMKQLMLRSVNKKSFRSCYVDTYKDTVILLVDTSGSMYWWSEILKKVTTIAIKRKDIEIYEAPNGIITRPVKSFTQLYEYYDWSDYEMFHEEFMKNTRNRVIIYIGDFDGGDTPYELAMNGNRVYWICNESRYDDTIEHDWCSHSLTEYPSNCLVLWAYNEQDLLKIFSRS